MAGRWGAIGLPSFADDARRPDMPVPTRTARKRDGGIGDVVTLVAVLSVLAVYVGAVFEPWVAAAAGWLT